jgi:hypothetical protein
MPLGSALAEAKRHRAMVVRHQQLATPSPGATVMSQISRGQIQDLVTKFAAENPKYRQALLADPKSVIEKQLNVSLGGVALEALVETADTTYVVVPHVPAEGELSDSDLEKVAGGFLDKNANCNNSPGAMNTFVQINL